MRTDVYQFEDLNMAILEVACHCQTETLNFFTTQAVPATFAACSEENQAAWLLERATRALMGG